MGRNLSSQNTSVVRVNKESNPWLTLNLLERHLRFWQAAVQVCMSWKSACASRSPWALPREGLQLPRAVQQLRKSGSIHLLHLPNDSFSIPVWTAFQMKIPAFSCMKSQLHCQPRRNKYLRGCGTLRVTWPCSRMLVSQYFCFTYM